MSKSRKGSSRSRKSSSRSRKAPSRSRLLSQSRKYIHSRVYSNDKNWVLLFEEFIVFCLFSYLIYYLIITFIIPAIRPEKTTIILIQNENENGSQ